ncbi:hypothetical protein HUA74_42090 [Myxococcus sp. CA051A]|uniref:hypothetical protein n=1 Tax=unclassified Myxococcus TaxID=2648731 RepID=UPI00157A65F4|nr:MULTISPECIES: hypothetical protein [unclassified Myxococcus]NTX06648.1 hypothetical protein [Myxococcus sp. CA040A]NTX67261.1 hypothetical protein [Myxococcus sp. CA051A]
MVAHPTLLRGLTFDGGSGRPMPSTENRPVLVERTDDDFISAFLAELGSDEGRKQLTATVRNAGEGAPSLKLYQPVHRSFQLAVLEALCDIPGEPRLDPASIESAGLVVRRLNPTSGQREGWMKLNGEVRGWVPLSDARALDTDPDPVRRKATFPAGHPTLDALVEDALGAPVPYEESVSRLFVAPPHVCAATRRTILYGLVPVASAEQVSGKAAPPPRYEEDELRDMLLPYFSASVGVNLEGIAGKTYSYRYSDELTEDDSLSGAAREVAGQRLEQFATFMRKLVSVFNAFESPAMKTALNRLTLRFGATSKPLGDALAEAADVFVLGRPERFFRMPDAWPRPSSGDVSALVRAGAEASKSRLATLLPRRGRFDVPEARYEVRAFLRVRRDDGCPPAILWGPPSQPFRIAHWYENGRLPPIQVALPAVTRENARNFLPNVAFQVPGNIFDLLSRNKAKDFLEEKAREGRSLGLDWICGFNIPIITLCAFIVLSIFLSLLNILFWWLPFIKICIPLPRRSR